MTDQHEHLSFDHIVEILEQRSTRATLSAERDHLATCESCSTTAAHISSITELMRSDALEDAPAAVRARASQLFSSRAQSPTAGLRRRLTAILQFDSRERPLAFGVRTGQPVTRQLLYAAGDADLDLRVSRSASHWELAGQVLGMETKGTVELEGESIHLRAALTDLGEFRLQPLPAGTYTLRIVAASGEIVVNDLNVGE